jgi:hypothetical protein
MCLWARSPQVRLLRLLLLRPRKLLRRRLLCLCACRQALSPAAAVQRRCCCVCGCCLPAGLKSWGGPPSLSRGGCGSSCRQHRMGQTNRAEHACLLHLLLLAWLAWCTVYESSGTAVIGVTERSVQELSGIHTPKALSQVTCSPPDAVKTRERLKPVRSTTTSTQRTWTRSEGCLCEGSTSNRPSKEWRAPALCCEAQTAQPVHVALILPA